VIPGLPYRRQCPSIENGFRPFLIGEEVADQRRARDEIGMDVEQRGGAVRGDDHVGRLRALLQSGCDQLFVDVDDAGDRLMASDLIQSAKEYRPCRRAGRHAARLADGIAWVILRCWNRQIAMPGASWTRWPRSPTGDDILLLIGSDHGHQTVTGVIDIDEELVTAG